MSDEPQLPEERTDGSQFERFQKLTRALFRVDKRDVPKHEPKKRAGHLKHLDADQERG